MCNISSLQIFSESIVSMLSTFLNTFWFSWKYVKEMFEHRVAISETCLDILLLILIFFDKKVVVLLLHHGMQATYVFLWRILAWRLCCVDHLPKHCICVLA